MLLSFALIMVGFTQILYSSLDILSVLNIVTGICIADSPHTVTEPSTEIYNLSSCRCAVSRFASERYVERCVISSNPTRITGVGYQSVDICNEYYSRLSPMGVVHHTTCALMRPEVRNEELLF